MKILFVIPSITNYFTFLEELISDFISHGHEIHLSASEKHITATNAYSHKPICQFHPIDFPRALAPIKHLIAARKLRQLVEILQPDFISIHFSAAVFTAMLAQKSSWPVTIGTIHGLGSPLIKGWRRRVISFAESWAFSKIDELYVLTADDQQYLQQKKTSINAKLLMSYGLGCNLKKFNPDVVPPERKEKLREELGIKSDDFVYIFIGRQTIFKGFDKVVKAFYLTLKSHPNSLLLLVGAKDLIHPVSPPIFKQATDRQTIINVGWQENVEDFLAIADVNVFPSEREGMPVNLMESLAMGVPVITVASRGCKEVVTHEQNGLVLQDRSIESIANAMQLLQDEPQKRNQFIHVAKRDAGKFTRDAFILTQHQIIYRLTGVNTMLGNN